MNASLRIRTATPDEADVLLEIQKASSVAGFGHVFPPEKYPFPNEAVLDRWQKAVDDPAEVVVLANLDGAAVGLAAMCSEWLDALYVIPSCWGMGVGPRLHDHALTWIRDLGCKRCHLWVLEQNTHARRFYEKRGWRLNGDTRVVPSRRIPSTSDTRSSCSCRPDGTTRFRWRSGRRGIYGCLSESRACDSVDVGAQGDAEV